MLEILLILGVMVYVVWKLESQHFERARSSLDVAAAEARPRIASAAPSRPRLAIEGTQAPLIRDRKFVTGFGVNPAALRDLRVYAGMGGLEQFPASLRGFIQDLHDSGSAVGTGIMELLFHGRALDEGEAVYFALIESAGEPRVVTFVDRLRLG
ncbi:MAG: hypothetical protein IT515_00725 [Burkholderiales bacterium]|nr:hypothetical protein [Burkholderiales bacterium]